MDYDQMTNVKSSSLPLTGTLTSVKLNLPHFTSSFVIGNSMMPKYKWKVRLMDDTHWMQVNAPNWFHRKMQELIFGFKWAKI
jgi:hypothetical protein